MRLIWQSFLSTKPMLIADMGFQMSVSMFHAGWGGNEHSRYLGIPLSAAAATAVTNTSNAVMNAADTFNQTNGDFGNNSICSKHCQSWKLRYQEGLRKAGPRSLLAEDKWQGQNLLPQSGARLPMRYSRSLGRSSSRISHSKLDRI